MTDVYTDIKRRGNGSDNDQRYIKEWKTIGKIL